MVLYLMRRTNENLLFCSSAFYMSDDLLKTFRKMQVHLSAPTYPDFIQKLKPEEVLVTYGCGGLGCPGENTELETVIREPS